MAVLERVLRQGQPLRHINIAIIMAMAEIDFSNLRDPITTRPASRNRRRTWTTSGPSSRTSLPPGQERVVEATEEGRDFYGSSRSTFYDTEYLRRSSVSTSGCTPTAAAAASISSSCAHHSGRSYSVFCVALPAACCPDCAARARQDYEDMKKKPGYGYLYLQDRIDDEYKTFETKTGRENTL